MKQVQCDFSRIIGTIKAQHGLCGNPKYALLHAKNSKDAVDAEFAGELLEEIDSPIMRLKGSREEWRTDSFNLPYGKTLDIPYIFRNMNKDAHEFINYDFFLTDVMMEDAWQSGKQVIVHLGAPYEFWKPIYCNKPDNYEKFADVCLHVVDRYNYGWMNGFHYGFGYWEIWHRADDPQCWANGSFEDYYRLYSVVAKKIKGKHPELKIGGPSAADCSGNLEFLRGFLSYVRENDVPCDFVSWNYYGTDPNEAYRQALVVRTVVEEANLKKMPEITNDEWNCMDYDENRRFRFPNVRTMQGAAFDCAFMIQMQKAGMDFCTYYSAEGNGPWSGLLDSGWVKAQKPLYTFVAFSRVFATGTEVKTYIIGDNVYAIAGSGNGKKAILVSWYSNDKGNIEICTHESGCKVVYLLDQEHNLTEVLRSSEESFSLEVAGYSVWLIEIREE